MRLVSDPQCSLSAVAQAISADPPLAFKTLRLVNAAYYGLRQKVSTIEHAVILLGIKVVKNLAFTASVFDVMKGSAESFFRHSISTGLVMRALADVQRGKPGVQAPEEAFVCGLLHDIGKVIMREFLPKEYAEVVRMCTDKRVLWHEAEREIIGVDHAQLGARLAEKWKLPDVLAQAVAGHHDLRRCSDDNGKHVAALVAVSDFISCSCAIAELEDPVIFVPDEVWEMSAISSTSTPAIMNAFIAALPSVDELMRVAA